MPKKSKCKYCQESFEKVNPLNPYCKPICERKANSERKKVKEAKVKEKKEKLFNILSITIKWVDDVSLREELRWVIEPTFIKFVWNKQIVVKVKRRKLKTKKKYLKDKLDDIFSKYIRARDKKCYCWSTENLQNWHYYSRVSTSTRFDEKNCNACCSSCNVIHEHDREPYTQFMLQKYWSEVIEELRLKYHWPSLILKEYDYEELIKEYELKLKELLK